MEVRPQTFESEGRGPTDSNPVGPTTPPVAMPSRRRPRQEGTNLPSTTVERSAGFGRTLLGLAADVVAPIVVYYGLTATGVGSYDALLLGAAIPGLSVIVSIVRHRRMDRLGVVVLITLLLGAGVSMITGSQRFLLVKDGWMTGLWALWIFFSLLAKRPVTYLFSRPLLEGRKVFDHGKRSWVPSTGEPWDSIWERSPRFRRIWKVTTVVWGTALLVDGVIRVVMAYTLPVDVVPGLGGALWPVTFVVLQVITNVYFFRSGFWMILSGDLDAPRNDEEAVAVAPVAVTSANRGPTASVGPHS